MILPFAASSTSKIPIVIHHQCILNVEKSCIQTVGMVSVFWTFILFSRKLRVWTLAPGWPYDHPSGVSQVTETKRLARQWLGCKVFYGPIGCVSQRETNGRQPPTITEYGRLVLVEKEYGACGFNTYLVSNALLKVFQFPFYPSFDKGSQQFSWSYPHLS